MPMTELEQLRIQLDQLVAEINELMEFRAILEDQIAVMAADASGNTNWSSANEEGVRNYLPFRDIYEEWSKGGTRAQRETLVWTSDALWTMQFIGGALVYGFERPGIDCGIIGRRAYAMVDGSRAIWMGTAAVG